uniref:Uncharacterized protein n=1 Tax=Arundo donax TaxID=35708 RepID=A0A0A9ASB9_ARUDO
MKDRHPCHGAQPIMVFQMLLMGDVHHLLGLDSDENSGEVHTRDVD